MSTHFMDAAIPSVDEVPRRTIDAFEKGAAAVVIIVVVCAIAAAYTSPIPYLWTAIAATTVMVYLAIISADLVVRALWVNLAVAVFVLGAAESYFWAMEPFERRMEYSDDFFIADEILGYKPTAGKAFVHRTSVRDGLLYEVTYTINSDGLRIAGPAQAGSVADRPCLVFFGDSFTFGEGIADERTMPFQVWKHLGGRYRTVNFGFLGYGPHQMLAAIEGGSIESQGRCRPTHVIYQTIPAHLYRSAGLEFWDPHGPRYVADVEGHVRQAGHFDEVPPTGVLDRLRSTHRQLSTNWKHALIQSALYRMLLRTHRPVNEQDVALYGGIVGAAKSLIETRYPESQFHVILWDYDEFRQDAERIRKTLAHHRVPVTTMSQILPDFPADHARYEIHPDDRHPNAQAHALIADFVAQRLIKLSTDESNH